MPISAHSVCLALCGIALLWSSLSATAADIVGRVVGVSDGDTITVLVDNHDRLKVRLAGIDAPEKSQPFGSVSKKSLSDQVFGKTVNIESNKKDRYGRFLGRVIFNGTDVCLEQIRAGMAWHYKRYSNDQSESLRREYADAEYQARQLKIGLWSEPTPVAPWEFRHQGRGGD
ncbi:thermonuclease family protein [Polynucleobacter sp. MWH-Aus1W21]|uniref:thermonuclease family protein n=1 Tax=Polynucleobacter sp. MWH-Aus1W21 TaxID=1855880 RepID=UPI001BFE34D9|nr:thermonuclease family protein [Polynucleobacter sp. MWH-Aus1W21]QWD65938.1 thermonuclease family protein [Polynucleobacter sp. MWH-Aus1W21]